MREIRRNTHNLSLLPLDNDKSILVLGRFNANNILVDKCVVLVAVPVCQMEGLLRIENEESNNKVHRRPSLMDKAFNNVQSPVLSTRYFSDLGGRASLQENFNFG